MTCLQLNSDKATSNKYNSDIPFPIFLNLKLHVSIAFLLIHLHPDPFVPFQGMSAPVNIPFLMRRQPGQQDEEDVSDDEETLWESHPRVAFEPPHQLSQRTEFPVHGMSPASAMSQRDRLRARCEQFPNRNPSCSAQSTIDVKAHECCGSRVQRLLWRSSSGHAHFW